MSLYDQFTVSTNTRSGAQRMGGTDLVTFSVACPAFSSNFEACCLPLMNQAAGVLSANFERYARTSLCRAARCDLMTNSGTDIPFHTYDAVQEYEIPCNQNRRLSVCFDQYQFTGGAHGNTRRIAQNWCACLSRELQLRDFYPNNPRYARSIQNEVIRQICQRNQNCNVAYFDNYADLVAQRFNPCNFYMTPDCLAIFFQQYDIAPYAMGIPVFLIPYSESGPRPPVC